MLPTSLRTSGGIGALRLALGLTLLTRPAQVLRLCRAAAQPRVVTLTRLLGARYVVQGSADLAVPHDGRLDTAVELLHAGSMVALARRDRQHARLALISAVVATALVALGYRPRPVGPAPERSLRYHVPVGQDPATVIAALRQAGYVVTRGEEPTALQDLVISGPDGHAIARDRVRAVITRAPIDLEGASAPIHSVVFEDEPAPTPSSLS